MGQCAVGLTDHQKEFVATAVAAHDRHLLAMTRMIAIANDRLTLMIPGSMSLLCRFRLMSDSDSDLKPDGIPI